MSAAPSHIPVMLQEVLAALAPKDGETYVDGTFGAGGYSAALLNAAHCTVIAIDRDPAAIARAHEMAKTFDGRLVPVSGAFGDVRAHLAALGAGPVDGFVLDIGVSSMQIDDPARGFSFNKDGPLDMRMDTRAPRTAADIVNDADERTLADIILRYGEERHARRIAAAIVRARAALPITTTLALARLVESTVPAAKKFAIHPATRTFQALRIAVNGEIDQLENALDASLHILKEGGRLAVVSFHSLEDSAVKTFFRAQGPASAGSRHLPERPQSQPLFTQIHKKALMPGEAECRANGRARSARLRYGIRTAERIAA